MKTLQRIVPIVGLLLGLSSTAAHAHGPGCWGGGVRIGFGGYCGPWYPGYYGYGPYYYPPSVYVVPPPVYAVPPPVAAPAYAVPPAMTTSSSTTSAPIEGAPVPVGAVSPPLPLPHKLEEGGPEMVNHCLFNLADRNEGVRLESVMQLGRIRARRAVDPLAATLAGDPSPAVREAAAKALGLIGAPSALPALTRSAQVDVDPNVRRTAQFSVEIIQAK